MKKAYLVCFSMVLALLLSSCGETKDDASTSTPAPAPKPLQPARADLIVVPDELKSPTQTPVDRGYIDLVNEQRPDTSKSGEFVFKAKTDLPLRIVGWAYDEAKKAVPGKIWIELVDKDNGQRIFLPAVRYPRPDVASGPGFSWALQSGITTNDVQDHKIPAGRYDIKIFQVNGTDAELIRFMGGVKNVTLEMQ